VKTIAKQLILIFIELSDVWYILKNSRIHLWMGLFHSKMKAVNLLNMSENKVYEARLKFYVSSCENK